MDQEEGLPVAVPRSAEVKSVLPNFLAIDQGEVSSLSDAMHPTQYIQYSFLTYILIGSLMTMKY